MNDSYLKICDVHMSFSRAGKTNPVLKAIDLDIRQGEFVSLIGHSGCGKSTVLNIVAGLLKASSGGVIVDGKEASEPGPDRAMVFQNHSLLPWLTCFENISLAVERVFSQKEGKPKLKARTQAAPTPRAPPVTRMI